MPYFHTHISYFWKKYEELHNFFDGKRLLIKWAFRESYQNLKNINNSWRKKAKSTEFLPFSQDKIGKKCLILGLFAVFWLEKTGYFKFWKQFLNAAIVSYLLPSKFFQSSQYFSQKYQKRESEWFCIHDTEPNYMYFHSICYENWRIIREWEAPTSNWNILADRPVLSKPCCVPNPTIWRLTSYCVNIPVCWRFTKLYYVPNYRI